MKKHLLISTLLAGLVILAAPSCSRIMEEDMPGRQGLPEGTPITMRLDFGYEDLMSVDVSTKAEASGADEERIHDLYVFIFCNGDPGEDHPHPGQKIYGRYFSYEHLQPDLATLDSSPNEGWFVENRTLDNVTKPISKTRGAVKISTRVCTSARIVVIANVDNGICKVGDREDVLDYLNDIWSYDELVQTQVKLTQDIVNRKDLFLMLGGMEDDEGNPKTKINTGEMLWYSGLEEEEEPSLAEHSNTDYQVKLKPVDAKVKFKVRINDPAITAEHGEYISAAKAVYWQVCNAPDHCYLFSDYAPDDAPSGTYPAPDETVYFDTEPAYFEGTEGDWYVFSFYMLESRFAAVAHASSYYDREKQYKDASAGKHGYTVEEGEEYKQRDDDLYVENGEWLYADPYAAYVKFDMILTLTPAGITALGGSVTHALTSDTIYTVHLGDFSNEEKLREYRFDDYNTYRSTCYTYEITIANAGTIYAEVKKDNERQPGQEGYLLLTDDEIVNADAHYEYHSITFYYDPETTPEKFSWYVKTPFTDKVGGGPIKGTKRVGDVDYPVYDPHAADGTLLDYRWVKFKINEVDVGTGKYSTKRVAYPGDDAYTDHKDWGVGEHGPWDNTPHPDLMDISQLIQYIFEETKKEEANPGSSDFIDDGDGQKVIRATIFIDEYYYTVDPRDESEHPQPDPNLWRQFVNAQPREMHILSRTVQSRDRKSDVIESSHSVIQQSIQTIYNIYEPSLRSIWGAEHLDEIKYTVTIKDGTLEENPAGNWLYWPEGLGDERAGAFDAIGKENGRLNSAYIWGLYSSQGNGGTFDNSKVWTDYMHYEVDNRIPEVNNEYRGMAWSCLTRNRDNDGSGTIDANEVRWYMAASQQLVGLWVGNESLSTTARLYQPMAGQWRSHVVSSTAKKVAWAEEGAGATDLVHDWAGSASSYHTWNTPEQASVGESVRCIRNIGTYDDPSEGLKDITFAPVTLIPDRYFTLKRVHAGVEKDEVADYESADDYYVFHFDRLNTKSIRNFSPGELPYHDQMSVNNCVYTKLVTQPLSTDVDAYSVYNGEINNIVTQNGHNDYCPEGYRFPNHTEMLMMELYLPDRYMKRKANGDSYTKNKLRYPTRTYYNRGMYGSLRSDTEPWKVESVKVGWAYSDKLHCEEYDDIIYQSRCVRDDDQTGVISGKISVEGNVIYPGDIIPVDFKFFSNASTLTHATLTLKYTNSSGDRSSWDLTSQLKQPSGLQYQNTQNITIPTLTQLGLSTAGFESADMKLEVELTNLSNMSGSDILDVQMKNPLEGRITLANGDELFALDDKTMSFDIGTHSREGRLETVSLQLKYKKIGASEFTYQSLDLPEGADISSDGKSFTHSGLIISIPNLDLPFDTDFSVDGELIVTVTDDAGLTGYVTKNVTLDNPLTGTFSIEGDYLYPNDATSAPLSFSTRSSLGTMSTVQLYLDYVDSGSTVHQEEITIPAAGGGKTYVQTPSISLDVLGSGNLTGLLSTDLTLHGTETIPYKEMTLRAVVSESLGYSKTISHTVKLRSHITSLDLEIVQSLDVAGFPVNVQANLGAWQTTEPSVSSLVLWWREQGGTWQQHTLINNTSLQQVITTSLSGISTFDSSHSFINYKLVAACSDGTTVTSPVWSMKFLRKDYNPNGSKWSDYVSHLDFEHGSYIQTKISTVGATVHKGELLGIGIGEVPGDCFDDSTKGAKTLHAFYRKKASETDKVTNLYISGWSPTNADKDYRVNKYTFDETKPLVLRLDNTGVYWNDGGDDNQVPLGSGANSLSVNFNNIINSDYLLVGSEQGVNRSNATYDFIRVIRQFEISDPSGFNPPVPGGNI